MPSIVHYVSAFNSEDTLIKQSDLIDADYVYTQCPVVTHKLSRVFVGISPIDFRLKINGTDIECTHPQYIEYDDQHLKSPKPVVQLVFPKFLFWTHEDNIWFQFTDHPMTALTNNFIAIGGWFNLSNWSRMSSTAITLVDETKPVIIKKGDPLFRVAFHPPNLNDGIILSQEKDPQKIDLIYEEYDKKQKEGQADKRWKPKLFSQTGQSKCPFSFLFK